MTVKERHYWKFIKQILFLLNYILFIIKICRMCKIKSHWMFSVVFFMFYICVICDCVCVLKYAIYLIWPRQFSFGPDSSHLAHVFLIWLIPWPEQKMSQRGPCVCAFWWFLTQSHKLYIYIYFFFFSLCLQLQFFFFLCVCVCVCVCLIADKIAIFPELLSATAKHSFPTPSKYAKKIDQ